MRRVLAVGVGAAVTFGLLCGPETQPVSMDWHGITKIIDAHPSQDNNPNSIDSLPHFAGKITLQQCELRTPKDPNPNCNNFQYDAAPDVYATLSIYVGDFLAPPIDYKYGLENQTIMPPPKTMSPS